MFAKLKVYIIMFAALAAFAGVAYWYYQDTQKALRQYAENQGKLEGAIQQQKAANEAILRDVAKMQSAMKDLNTAFEESRKSVENITGLLTQGTDGRDMSVGERAVENPEARLYIEDSVNTGTAELFRCFEILSGATPGDADANAKFIKCVDTSNDADGVQSDTKGN